MEIIQNNNNNQTNEDGGISLRSIFEMLFSNWYWYLLTISVSLGLAYFYSSTLSPQYERSAVLLVKDNHDASGVEAMASSTGVLMGTNSLENELYMLRSNMLMSEVVKRADLDIIYTRPEGFRIETLYGSDLPFKVTFLDEFDGYVSITVSALRSEGVIVNQYVVNGQTQLVNQFVPFGKKVKSAVGLICISPNSRFNVGDLESPITIQRIDRESATAMVRGGITTAPLKEESSLVSVVCRDANYKRADAALAAVLAVYDEMVIKDKREMTSHTADFIDERIQVISQELGDVEHELSTFKQQNRMLDVSSKAQSTMAEGEKWKAQTLELEAQMNVVSFVRDFVANKAKSNELIPNVSGIGDAGVQEQIGAYNALLLKRDRLVENSGKNNSVVLDMNGQLEAMRKTIAGSIEAYAHTLSVQLNSLRRLERKANYKLANIPMQEKFTLDVMRQQKIKESLYEYLLKKREETNMQLAVIKSNVYVVEAPYGSTAPIGPNKSIYFTIALIVGLAIPSTFIFGRLILDTGIRGRRDIEHYTTIPLLGDIPNIKTKKGEEKDIAVGLNKNDHITEAFRLLRTNLSLAYKDARVLMFTSTMAHEGKTFVSRNFAATLAFGEKKVIVVDTDIRKAKLSKILDANTKHGLSTYLNGSTTILKDLIMSGKLSEMVDFLPAGAIPPNPAELLMNHNLERLIAELKELYDYIILDNVPAMVVADPAIINRVVDVTIYVMRDGLIDRRYLPELERIHLSKKFNNMCLVINDVKEPKKGYRGYGYYGGYGYGNYGYGTGYGYGYGYYDGDGALDHQRNRVISRKSFITKMFSRKK